ncbi:MAG: hypothetical protein H0V40_01050 [Actinobacteria bacterium]|nr:hypothetical protein [Actinomycetota bacterium]
MTASRLVASALVCTGLVLGCAWLFEMPLERAAVLAPVIVVSAAATLGIVVLWARVALDSLRRQRHPLRIVAGALAVLTALVVLSFFVQLPDRY